MRVLVLSWVLFVLGNVTLPTYAAFQGLGDLPGGEFYSWVYDVSADGSRVVGLSVVDGSGSNATYHGYQWNAYDGMIDLGNPLGGGSSRAHGIAWDAEENEWITVGAANFTSWSSNTGHAYQTAGTTISERDLLCRLPGVPGSSAMAISDDASAIVGGGSGRAWRWTGRTGVVDLGDLPGGATSTNAFATSADGSVVVGVSWSDKGREAFRMTGDTIASGDGLGDLPGGAFDSWALDVSADGATVVGYGQSASGTEAFRWTHETGIVGLGGLPGGRFESYAQGVSGNGSIVVGTSETAEGRQAFIWDAENGMRNLSEVLVNDYGADLAGWTLNEALKISNDGRTIVGGGINPQGNTEAWIATLGPIFNAGYSYSPPKIDGAFSPGEWQDANAVTMERRDGGGSHDSIVYLQHDEEFLYVGVDSQWGKGWDVVWDIAVDGDHDGSINGSVSKPYVDVDMACPSPGGYPDYRAYYVLTESGEVKVPFDDGAMCMSAGTDNIVYEFRVPLTHLDAAAGDSIGFFLSHGYDGITEHLYEMSGVPRSDPQGWMTVRLGVPGPIPGDMNGDGIVGSADLDIVRANWGRYTSAGVPEPGIAIFGVLGMLYFVLRRARR